MSSAEILAGGGTPGLTGPSRTNGARRRLGDVIVDLGYAQREQVEAAAIASRERGAVLGEILVEERALNPQQLAHALAERNGLPHLDLTLFPWDRAAASLIDTRMARRYGALPVAYVDEGTLLVAITDPANVLAVDDIRIATGCRSWRAVTSPDELEAVLSQLSRIEGSVQPAAEEEEEPDQPLGPRDAASEGRVVKLVNAIVAEAVERGAPDVHLEPRRGDLRVRMRIDGIVVDSTLVPKGLAPALVSRIKLMADLDIAERRAPQDGRVGLTVDGRHIDLRVATLPVVHGEAIVLRVLDNGRVGLGLSDIGMAPEIRESFERAIRARSGAILVTGPTGSGKTTTLYAGLQLINSPDTTVTTLEDPVEYELEGVKQVQVNPRAGLTFATGLRSMVRADPDVLMVGEVRDRETAQIAMEAALTGHLVLTTLHTNSAPTAAIRLVEMGIEPFLVTSGVQCVLAQRLARRLCSCKRPVKLEPPILLDSGFAVDRGFDAWEAAGCLRCAGSGYRGRVGIFELLTLSSEVRELILRKASAGEIAGAAGERGMTTLRDDGLAKLRAGETSVSEVLRVLGPVTD